MRSASNMCSQGKSIVWGCSSEPSAFARARMKIGLANLAYNFQRLAWLEGRTAPA